MNTERFHPLPINDLSQERLDDSLFRFADVLSGRKWDEQRVMAVSMDWRRLERGDSLAVELRPAILEYISEDPQTREREIMRQAEGLDNEFERHFFEGSVKEMLRADRQPTESVVRQILGMLAIVSADVRGYRP